eukprot:TRINITY_DN633_c1_g2_i1.p1 TRINITY_DN633_c1_g2~~TRINITY_DN633_c1_g2_i1.p1  ORF type:complete len:349 (+),score=55.31 TRINITY_DN633_c1_g2_i1:76-1122(+)
MRSLLSGLSLLSLFAAAQSHICIIEPHQRGAMNISSPADDTCFRRYPSCGGIAAGPVTATYRVNEPTRILFQQNLNHWNQDKPGHFDLAVSYNNEATWETLKTFGDFPGNDMVQQTNFTFDVKFTQVAKHAILRLRYISYNKFEVYPKNNTDAVFYQCSDIEIVPSTLKAIDEEPTTIQVAEKASSCTTPKRWTATSTSNLQHTKIYYDATGPIVRWDRTVLATGITTSYITNYTLTSEGIIEYGIQEDTKSCITYGADKFYPWAYGSIGSAQCADQQDIIQCADHSSGVSWSARRISGSDMCLPHSLQKPHEHIEFRSEEVSSFDPSTFKLPSYCKSPSVKKISCHQ